MKFIFYFIRQVYKKWLLILCATVGIVSGTLTIFPLPEKSNITNFIILCACLLFSITITLIIYHIKNIQEEEIWMFEVPKDKPFIVFPYQKSYLKAANSLARIHYGKSSVNYGIVRKWYEKNQFSLTVLTDSHRKFVGYFDILPLTSNFGKDFVNGILREKDIRHRHILPPDQMCNTEYLYFAGISVIDQHTQLGRKYGAILIYAAIIYLEKFYDLSEPKTIYAIPVSDCGKNLIEKLDFQIEMDKSNRSDKLDLYSRIFSKKEIHKYKKQFLFCENKFDYSSYSKALQHTNS